MTEKLKYKVGDKVLVPFEILEVKEGDSLPYATKRLDRDNTKGYWTKGTLESIAITLPPKPVVTQAMMDWYETEYNGIDTVGQVIDYFVDDSLSGDEIAEWLFDFSYDKSVRSKRQHALATLIAYGPQAVEVEKEKRYRVVFKSSGQVLAKVNDRIVDEVHFMFLHNKHGIEGMCYPKQELIDAGFEGVFDNPMFEVEEVE